MEFTEAFYNDPYLTEQDSTVQSCEPCKKGYKAVLSDTIFYPEEEDSPRTEAFSSPGMVPGSR